MYFVWFYLIFEVSFYLASIKVSFYLVWIDEIFEISFYLTSIWFEMVLVWIDEIFEIWLKRSAWLVKNEKSWNEYSLILWSSCLTEVLNFVLEMNSGFWK